MRLMNDVHMRCFSSTMQVQAIHREANLLYVVFSTQAESNTLAQEITDPHLLGLSHRLSLWRIIDVSQSMRI